MIDLHNHTVASDGDFTPAELVDLAVEKGLSAIAITDHDSVASVKKVVEYSADKEIEIVPGVELSCNDPLFDYDKIDVLGLFIDCKNQKLIDLIAHINERREETKKRIIEKLKSFNYAIEYEDVKKTVVGTFGRPHIARYLMSKYPSKFSSIKDVFNKLIGDGQKAYLATRNRVSIKDAIAIIKDAGGIAILAHPGIYPKDHSIGLIDHFIDNGGDGIETYYPYHLICPRLNLSAVENEKIVRFYKEMAESKNILESGGSDHHDKCKPVMGAGNVPGVVLEKLKSALGRVQYA